LLTCLGGAKEIKKNVVNCEKENYLILLFHDGIGMKILSVGRIAVQLVRILCVLSRTILGGISRIEKLYGLLASFKIKGKFFLEGVGKFTILLPLGDLGRYLAIKSGNFESHVLEVFEPKRGQIVVDAGAHVGYYTLIASRKVGRGKVIAIEPHPLNFQLLKTNIRLNKLKNVIAVKVALSDSDGEAPLYLGCGSGKHTIIKRAGKQFINVRTVRLDSLLNKLGISQVHMIKIDGEGAELDVLKGAESILTQSNVELIIEVHNIRKIDKIQRYLVAKGFKVISLKARQALHCGGSLHLYAKN